MFHLIYTFSPQENLHSLTLWTGPTALITSETHNEDRYRCEMRMNVIQCKSPPYAFIPTQLASYLDLIHCLNRMVVFTLEPK